MLVSDNTDIKRKNCYKGQRKTLYSDKRVNSSRCNNYKCICT